MQAHGYRQITKCDLTDTHTHHFLLSLAFSRRNGHRRLLSHRWPEHSALWDINLKAPVLNRSTPILHRRSCITRTIVNCHFQIFSPIHCTNWSRFLPRTSSFFSILNQKGQWFVLMGDRHHSETLSHSFKANPLLICAHTHTHTNAQAQTHIACKLKSAFQFFLHCLNIFIHSQRGLTHFCSPAACKTCHLPKCPDGFLWRKQ